MTTRAQFRIDVQNIADAYNSPRWDFSPGGEVDRRLGMVHAREWKKILGAAPYYQVAQYTPTTDGNGNILLSQLTAGSGDTLQQLYRVLSVWFNNTRYEYVEARNWMQSVIVPVNNWIWYRNGNQITVPYVPNTIAQGVFCNWYPQRFDQLATDNSVVSLPIDYDDVFNYEGAAALFMKGSAESASAAELRAYADSMRQDLLADLARISTDPATIQYGDSPLEWGE